MLSETDKETAEARGQPRLGRAAPPIRPRRPRWARGQANGLQSGLSTTSTSSGRSTPAITSCATTTNRFVLFLPSLFLVFSSPLFISARKRCCRSALNSVLTLSAGEFTRGGVAHRQHCSTRGGRPSGKRAQASTDRHLQPAAAEKARAQDAGHCLWPERLHGDEQYVRGLPRLLALPLAASGCFQARAAHKYAVLSLKVRQSRRTCKRHTPGCDLLDATTGPPITGSCWRRYSAEKHSASA